MHKCIEYLGGVKTNQTYCCCFFFSGLCCVVGLKKKSKTFKQLQQESSLWTPESRGDVLTPPNPMVFGRIKGVVWKTTSVHLNTYYSDLETEASTMILGICSSLAKLLSQVVQDDTVYMLKNRSSNQSVNVKKLQQCLHIP